MIPPLFGRQDVGIWRVKKRFPRDGVPIWSLWPNIRFLPSIVAAKNATKNGHIQNVCSMCIKINKVGKQEVGIWWIQKRFLRYVIYICFGFACLFFCFHAISSFWSNICIYCFIPGTYDMLLPITSFIKTTSKGKGHAMCYHQIVWIYIHECVK
jgi:hypothetical protein